MYDNVAAQDIAAHTPHDPLLDFTSVNVDTDIYNLNLNWRERDLPERVRTKHVHRLHPYMGKFIPQLAEIFLRKFTPRIVYDPFCGSGTTLVEANALGIDAIGTDISAFNVLLSQVKTATYDTALLGKEIKAILKQVPAERKLPLLDAWIPSNQTEERPGVRNAYLQEWFAPQARKELLHYRDLIPTYHYQDVLKIILSRAARSARLVTHYDLDFPKKPQTKPYSCYKHGRTCTPTQEALKFLLRYSLDTLKRITAFADIKSCSSVTVTHGDAREVPLPNGIDMVLTSPPYVGLIDYHHQHQYAYELLGFKNNETKEIGAAKKGVSMAAKEDYRQGINEVLLHTREAMADRGIMVIVVNDRHDLYDASAVGFTPIGRVERHVNRRTGRRKGTFYESILIWEKA